MSDGQKGCEVQLVFEDVLLAEPSAVQVACDESSRLFPYYLRQQIHALKRVPPFEQQLTRLGNNKYSVKIRRRDPKSLHPLTIHGHYFDEYNIQIDKKDTVLDVKFLLAPLVSQTNNAHDIQLNFNTTRRLRDEEVLFETGCVGNSSVLIMFWFELTNPRAGESPIYQTVARLSGPNPLYPDVGSSVRRVLASRKGDPTALTLGNRTYLSPTDLSQRGDFEYIDYDTVNARIDAISVALQNILFNPNAPPSGPTPSQDGYRMFGICSANRREWILCDYACAVSNIVSVPLYPTLDANALTFITNHAGLRVIATDAPTLKEIVPLLDSCESLQYVVLMNDFEPDRQFVAREAFTALRRQYSGKIFLLSELERMAREGIQQGNYVVKDEVPRSQDELYTIMYTSGTTGNPKGVMISHANMMSVIAGMLTIDFNEKYPLPPGAEKVHLSYLPLAHSMERMLNLVSFIRGAKIGFWRGDRLGLIEDMKVIKPPMFVAVPRIFQKVQAQIVNSVQGGSWWKRKLFDYAYRSKLALINSRADLKGNIWDRLVFSKINEQFGGNIMSVGSGSAPLTKELQVFLKVCLAPVILEGYGLTETTASGTGTHPYDLTVGHVGTPRVNTSLKLVNVPDRKYFVTDKPHPRGEILMRGGSVFKGYYRDADKTREVLDDEGWFSTGDIGEWRAEGKLVIIDRKKNIFKLSQGEYVRPEYLQNVYKMSQFIQNMFVHGDSTQNYLVAVIVPDFEALGQIDTSLGKMECLQDEGLYAKVEGVMKQELKKQEEGAKLNGFERVKRFVLVGDDFTPENGLLTTTMKLKRNEAKLRFKKEIEQMYQIKSKL